MCIHGQSLQGTPIPSHSSHIRFRSCSHTRACNRSLGPKALWRPGDYHAGWPSGKWQQASQGWRRQAQCPASLRDPSKGGHTEPRQQHASTTKHAPKQSRGGPGFFPRGPGSCRPSPDAERRPSPPPGTGLKSDCAWRLGWEGPGRLGWVSGPGRDGLACRARLAGWAGRRAQGSGLRAGGPGRKAQGPRPRAQGPGPSRAVLARPSPRVEGSRAGALPRPGLRRLRWTACPRSLA